MLIDPKLRFNSFLFRSYFITPPKSFFLRKLIGYLDNIKIFEGFNAPLSISKTNLLDFELYPNPTRSNINIFFKDYNTKNSFVTIYNPLGEVMLCSKLDGYQTLLPTKKLSSGIYIVQLFQSGKSSTKYFIKRKE